MRLEAHNEDLEKAFDKMANELLETNEKLRLRERELEIQTLKLERITSSLKALTEEKKDESEIEKRVLQNIKKLIDPYLERLKNSGLAHNQMRYLSTLQSTLDDIASPLVSKLASSYFGLSPTEIRVANLIKQGKRNKEIAEIMNLSENTIMSHRYKIRTKLGLKRKKTNLYSYLNSLK